MTPSSLQAKRALYGSRLGRFEHDPEKWKPVFRKDHAQTKRWSGMTIRRKVIPF
jgi:hypothetical protein